MKRTTEEKLREPREILAAMDKEGVRSDSILIAQLNAELNVSLAVEADRVSKRNLKVAQIACIVAVIALGISTLQFFQTCGKVTGSALLEMEFRDKIPPESMETEVPSTVLEPKRPSTTSIYKSSALLHFQGGVGPDTLIQNHIRNLETEEFKAMVVASFGDLWNKMHTQNTEEEIPKPGKYNFKSTERLVTITAEASDPNVAIVTANAVAQSSQILYLDKARRSSDESVAWLQKQADKEMEELQDIDQKIRKTRNQNDIEGSLQGLLKRRKTQAKIVNGIRERIEEERLRHDRNSVAVHVLEQAEKAFKK